MEKLNKILLIDDDEVTNYINKELLEGLDIAHKIQIIEDGDRALDYLMNCAQGITETCPEFVIFDHQMPKMDGKELMEALNEVNFIKENEVVFMSLGANPSQKDVEVFKRLGVQEFTKKPLSEKAVLDAFNKHW